MKALLLLTLLLVADYATAQYSNYETKLDDMSINSTVCFDGKEEEDCVDMAVVFLKGGIYMTELCSQCDVLNFVKTTKQGELLFELHYNYERTGQLFRLFREKSTETYLLLSVDRVDVWDISISKL